MVIIREWQIPENRVFVAHFNLLDWNKVFHIDILLKAQDTLEGESVSFNGPVNKNSYSILGCILHNLLHLPSIS